MAEWIKLDVFLMGEGEQERRIKLDKDVRLKGPYELPKGWKWVKLRYVAKTMTGGTPSRSREEYFGGSIPWVKSGELEDGYVTKTEESLTESGLNNSSAKIFPAGTLLVAMYGATVGRVGILKINAATNQAVCAVFPDGRILDKMFLFYYFQKIRPKLIGRSFGGAQPNISQQFIRRLKIPLLPLEEQRRIVTRIEELVSRAEEAKRLRRIAREEAEKIMQAALNKVFSRAEEEGWEQVKLGEEEYFKRFGGGTPKRSIKEYWENGTIPWLTNTEIPEGRVIRIADTKEKITKLGLRNSSATLVPKDSVILGCTASIGKVAIAGIQLTTNQQFNSFKCNKEKVLPEFLAYYFLTQKRNLEAMAGKTTFRHIIIPRLLNLQIALSPLEEQKRIVAYLDKIGETVESLNKLQQGTEEELEKLAPAILDRAFKGEL